jgi:hypothetical protein
MGKFFFIQAFYCITGILFFTRDLFNKVPMGQGMVRAFIWPYAQWPVMKAYGLQLLQPVLQVLHISL